MVIDGHENYRVTYVVCVVRANIINITPKMSSVYKGCVEVLRILPNFLMCIELHVTA
jgi:hypothetical protein